MKHLLSTSAAGLALAGLAAGSIGAQAAPSQAMVPTLSRATQLQASDTVLGTLASSKAMHVALSLKLRNQSKLDAFLANPHHPILTPAQFTARFSPTAEQAQAVATFMKKAGFSNVTIAPNRLMVSGDATASTVQSAFQTRLVSVQTHDGRLAYANSSAPKVPTALQGTVLAVLGLQNVHVLHTTIVRASQQDNRSNVLHGSTAEGHRLGTHGIHPNSVTGHNPTEFSSIYGGSGAPTASGVTIGIVTEGSLTNIKNDLNSFTSQNGLATVTTQTVNTNGTSSDTSGDPEWDLDSQDIVGMSGGQVGKLIFYNIPSLSNANLTADFNTIVNADATKVINVSLGECETDAQGDGSAASQDQSFQQADTQGQTISVSSGDSGADECGNGGTTPSWPAASQYVVAVGGTTLNASTTTWNSATAWSDGGGSPSTFEAMPSWQQGVGQNAGHSTRGVPDVAFDADPNSGSKIIVDGQQQQYGGTSLASPLFVGTWARVIAAQGTSVGFAAPLIYQLPSSDFHDITSGSNGGESAATGWDYTTGFGSMIISDVVNDIGGGSGGGSNPPTASNGSVSTNENTAVNGTLSASDPNGDALTFSIENEPSHGSVSITNASTGAFTYTPNNNYSGSDSFTFEATDSAGLTSNTATESVTVNSSGGGNNPPTASNGSITTNENTAKSGTLSASDPDGDALTFSIVSQPSHGSVSITNASSGAFTYTPNSNYYGSDSFTFKANDGQADSNTATESVTVNQVTTGGCANGYTSYTASVSQGNDSFQPDGNYYHAKRGREKGILTGPSGTDFDLYLYQYSYYWGWEVVAESTSNTSNESINYNGSAGYYYWDIYAYAGSGTYGFCLKRP
ncbi:MAG: Ig-like domain-containing protein [Gammaproteobacteria bacterium]